MIKAEHIETWGFEHAIRGMRNPLNSWGRSDSTDCIDMDCLECALYDRNKHICSTTTDSYVYAIGKNDMKLMKKLTRAGQPHRKYLRQIFVSMDITAPLYWWKEFDTYKVGTVANSCSTMHTIHKKEFSVDDFSIEHLNDDVVKEPFETIISRLNFFRELYLLHKQKEDWWQLIQLLPASYNQKRTVTFNYENALNIIEYRTDHKLDEWQDFIKVLKHLPYMQQLI